MHLDVVALCLLLHPLPVFVDVGGVDDDEIVVVAHLIDEKVIDRATVGIEHHAVENLACGHVADVVGENVVDILFCLMSSHCHFAHVTDIKHTA